MKTRRDKDMEQENEKLDYSELSMPELTDKMHKLMHKLMPNLMYELTTSELTEELKAWSKDGRMDVDAVTDELADYIEVFTELKAVCEEMLRMVCDKEFDE